MGILGKPQGVFDLNDSDRCVGSFLQKTDLSEILNVSDKDLAALSFVTIDNQELIDERKVQKAWYKGEIPNAPSPKNSSLDELILRKIIEKTYPNCKIETQLKVGRFKMDFYLKKGDKEIYLEFDGPSHFAISRFGVPNHEPFRKKKIVEEKTGIEVVNWPYWMQRCSANVKALFQTDTNGLGVLWSTNIHFGDFYFENSAEIIQTINKRFNADDEMGVGYFYGPESKERNNPEHPVIEQIISNKTSINKIIPKGSKNDDYWLPKKLKN